MKSFFIRAWLVLGCWAGGLSSLPAQVGGRESFTFLRLPADARTVGLGGINVSLQDTDANRFQANPALLTDSTRSYAGFSYMRWQASIDVFQACYTPRLPKVGQIGFSLQAMNYGQMPLTLPNGIQQGTFRAQDFAFGVGKSITQGAFTYGATLKWITSYIAGYNAMGLSLDAGVLFRHPKQPLTIGITVRNVGFSVNNYTDTRLLLPLDIQLGVTFKPQYMPVRFTLSGQQLHRWDIVYLNPTQSTQLDASGNPIPPQKSWGDQLMRHFVIGGELLLSRQFEVLLGYNHLQAREMKLSGVGGLRGFTFGARFQNSRWQFAFARGLYAQGAGKNMISLSTNLSKTLIKRKKV